MKESIHKPVLLKEVLEIQNPIEGIYVDCTLGGGGYTLAIADRLMNKGGEIYAIDVDESALNLFREVILRDGWIHTKDAFVKNNVAIHLINKNFALLHEILREKAGGGVDGIVADLGLSSDQLDTADRGFSFQVDGPLDMRMDKSLGVTAADLVNGLYENELTKLFYDNDERFAKLIARAIIRERQKKPIKTTLHLTNIIQKALPHKARFQNTKTAYSNRTFRLKDAFWKKPAMRVFQSLRIAVNSELSSLQKMLPQAFEALAAGGIFTIVSFHSGEDRIVKNFISQYGDSIEILTKKPIEASGEELHENMRARSAKLRAYKKL